MNQTRTYGIQELEVVLKYEHQELLNLMSK
jgi:hypothetical protein